MSFTLTSAAFGHGGAIPQRHTGDGANISPPLAWEDPPAGTESLALVVDDPDAPGGTFQHWGIYNLGAESRSLPEGASGGFNAVLNDYGTGAYRGPKPPRGHGPHRYHFRLMALDTGRLSLPPNATVPDLWAALRPHLLAEAQMVGTYER